MDGRHQSPTVMLSRRPFARIPAEICDHIFGLVASSDRGRLKLLAINQDFRSYALSSPWLWTRIFICKSDTLRTYASTCIALSCQFTLDITLKGSGDLISSHPDLVPFFRTAPRWRSATLHLSEDFPWQSCQDFPCLEELTIHFVDYGVLPPFVIQNAPRLLRLSLHHIFPLSSIQIPFRSLTELRLEFVSFRQSLQILALTSVLKTCHLEALSHILDGLPFSPVSIATLTHLDIASEHPLHLIQALGNPNLEYLELRHTTGCAFDIHHLNRFLTSCTKLRFVYLHGPIFPEDRVCCFFDSVPGLFTLRWDATPGEFSNTFQLQRPLAIIAALAHCPSYPIHRLPGLRLFETNSVWLTQHIKAITGTLCITCKEPRPRIHFRHYISRFVDQPPSDILGLEEEFNCGAFSVIASLRVRDA